MKNRDNINKRRLERYQKSMEAHEYKSLSKYSPLTKNYQEQINLAQ